METDLLQGQRQEVSQRGDGVSGAESAALPALNISVEMLLYIVLIAFALLVRLADIDVVPMREAEAVQALAAWHAVEPDAPGMAQVAESPIVFWLQTISFAFLGASEFAARLPGVIGGLVLMLMPLLFRRRYGRDIALSMSLLLAVSPVAFVAARTSDATVWTMVFAMGLLWALREHFESRQRLHARWVALFAGALVFLSGADGILIAAMLLGAGAMTVWWLVANAPLERDTPGDDIVSAVRTWLSALPLSSMALIAFLLVFLVATGFMLNPTGMSSVAQGLGAALAGFLQPAQANAPFAHGLLAIFVYEPLFLLTAILSIGVLVVAGVPTIENRFLRAWALIAALALLFYRGATAADALWLIVPLAWLVADFLRTLLENVDAPVYIYSDYGENGARWWWVKWMLCFVVLGLLFIFNLHLQEVGRGLLSLPNEGTFDAIFGTGLNDFRYSFIWVVITLLFLILGFVLAASLWGNYHTAQGYGLGLVGFVLLTGVATGWSVAVANADHPAEIWQPSATHNDAQLLRETLQEIAQRDTMGFTELPVSIVLDDSASISADGLMAWLVRDFENARFVSAASEAARDEIIVMAQQAEEPELGGSYVGQSFVLTREFSLGSLRLLDLPAWLLQRQLGDEVWTQDVSVLWLRVDVYDGVPANERLNG